MIKFFLLHTRELEQRGHLEMEQFMIHIHDKELNKTDVYNLLHDTINPPKRAKNVNSH